MMTHRVCLVGLCLFVAVLAPFQVSWAEFREIDGSGNNLTNDDWGSAGVQLLRLSDVDYPGDGSGSTMIYETERPNPRSISNALSNQTSSVPSAYFLSSGVWQWGQFIDHDIDLTNTGSSYGSLLIESPGVDPYGVEMIPFSRSHYDSSTGDSSANPRQQINEISAYLDASNIYGSDATRAAALRTNTDGLLKTSGANDLLLPTDDTGSGLESLPNADGGFSFDPGDLFVSGDVRANEQLALTAMHTLFMREHNRVAGELKTLHPTWTDDDLYDMARKVVGAEEQAITYNEFLPALLGPAASEVQAEDWDYDDELNAGIANDFSTVAYRFGHSMLNDVLVVASDGGTVVDELQLRDSFFNPDVINDDADPEVLIDQILMGLTAQRSQEIDLKIIDDVRNFLFAPSGDVGLDLGALNIQRGRDHGIPDYNEVRQAYGLSAIDSFDDITDDTGVQTALSTVYSGDVNNIDAWIGILAEKHLDGMSVGETLKEALIDQFVRLRDGDRLFYIGCDDLWTTEMAGIVDFSTLTLMDVISWNTSMSSLPASFFIYVPEPATWTLALFGLAMGLTRRRRRSSGGASVVNRLG